MPKVKITTEFLRRVKPPLDKSKEQYFDSELIGFMLEVKSTGAKTYYYRYRENSSQKMLRIGNKDEITLQEAHVKYYALAETKSNHKPLQDTHSLRQESSIINPITFKEFFYGYYEPYAKTHIKSYETNISVFKNHILKDLGNIQMNMLKKIEVMQLHSNMIHTKKLSAGTANKFLIFLNQAYNLSHEFELLPRAINPCKGVKPYELNNQRQIFLSKAQTKRLLQEVNKSANVHLKYIIPMLLLSGARKREVLDANWCDFDMNNMLWTIPVTKSGKKRVLPITPPMQEILQQIPKKSKYLFASCKTDKPYRTIFQSWNSARVKANLPEVRIHDLRHTYASALVNAKCSLYEVQILLGHSTAKMTQRYAHLSNEALMSAASCAGKLLK